MTGSMIMLSEADSGICGLHTHCIVSFLTIELARKVLVEQRGVKEACSLPSLRLSGGR